MSEDNLLQQARIATDATFIWFANGHMMMLTGLSDEQIARYRAAFPDATFEFRELGAKP